MLTRQAIGMCMRALNARAAKEGDQASAQQAIGLEWMIWFLIDVGNAFELLTHLRRYFADKEGVESAWVQAIDRVIQKDPVEATTEGEAKDR